MNAIKQRYFLDTPVNSEWFGIFTMLMLQQENYYDILFCQPRLNIKSSINWEIENILLLDFFDMNWKVASN